VGEERSLPGEAGVPGSGLLLEVRDHDVVGTYSATTALPYPHLERATAGLRAELRHRLLAAEVDELPDWSTLEVRGPVEVLDGLGRTWFEYEATVAGRVIAHGGRSGH
jgi:hypothetical protein